MILEISFNSENLDFSINEKVSKNNLTNLFESSKKERGKITLIIKPNNSDFIYLNIFNKEDNSINDIFLNNYVFKYSNVEKTKEYIQNNILDNNEELIIKEKTVNDNNYIECSFNKIDLEKYKANITYSLKIIDENKYYEGESYETIALTESSSHIISEKNPSDNNGTITLSTNYNFTNIIYIQVIAIIEQENNKEYISYKGLKYSRYSEQKEEKEEEVIKEEEMEEEEEKEEKNEEEEEKEEEMKKDKEEKEE